MYKCLSTLTQTSNVVDINQNKLVKNPKKKIKKQKKEQRKYKLKKKYLIPIF